MKFFSILLVKIAQDIYTEVMTSRFVQQWSQLLYSMMRNTRKTVKSGKTIDFLSLSEFARKRQVDNAGKILLARNFVISG